MQPIPKKHKKIINNSPYFKTCCVCGVPKEEIDHVFQYNGKQIIEIWNYAPLCTFHHKQKTMHSGQYNKKVRYLVEYKALCRMRPEDKAKYNRRNWDFEKEWLKTQI